MSQMTSDTFSKQVPILLEALGAHMRAHALPLPLDIDIDTEAQTVSVRVAAAASAQQRWLDTLVIDTEENKPSMGPIWVRTAWGVRLPDLGMRFFVVGHRMLPAALVEGSHLSVVPA